MEIFCVDLNLIKVDLNYCQKFLSAEEKVRFGKISNPKAKRNFAYARFLVKKSLSNILNCKPEDALLKPNYSGKPELVFPESDLKFNLSHSGDYIVWAINKGEVGIDVEYLKNRDFLGIAKDFFVESEFVVIKNASEAERKNIFYRYWTARESLVKCKSLGIFDKIGEIDFEKMVARYMAKEYRLLTIDLEKNYVMSAVWDGISDCDDSARIFYSDQTLLKLQLEPINKQESCQLKS